MRVKLLTGICQSNLEMSPFFREAGERNIPGGKYLDDFVASCFLRKHITYLEITPSFVALSLLLTFFK